MGQRALKNNFEVWLLSSKRNKTLESQIDKLYFEVLLMFQEIVDFFTDKPEVIIEITIGLVGFLGVILSLRADRKVKVAEFIAQYNLIFLTTPEFTNVERKLEGCYDAYCRYFKNNKCSKQEKHNFESKCDKIFGTNNLEFENSTVHKKYTDDGAITEEYQSIVNYLVYLESFATLITQKRVRIKDIDDLFGYRFFIAVNNPVIQQNELSDDNIKYYRGIVKAYKIWTKHYKHHRKNIFIKDPIIEPMKAYGFSEK